MRERIGDNPLQSSFGGKGLAIGWAFEHFGRTRREIPEACRLRAQTESGQGLVAYGAERAEIILGHAHAQDFRFNAGFETWARVLLGQSRGRETTNGAENALHGGPLSV